MTKISQGGTIRLTVQFYEYYNGPPYDPSQPITLDIKLDGVSVLDDVITYDPGEIERESLGFFSYDWAVPSDAELGEYTAFWTGKIHDNVINGTEVFEVVAPGSADTDNDTDTDSNLGVTTFVTFGAVFDPMYVDPEDITLFFPEATYLDAAKFIYTFSNEVKQILKISSADEENLSWIVYEYVKAATLCALSRLYPNARSGSDNGFGGEVNRMQLGDFQVEYNKSGGLSSMQGTSRGNASSWCEYAEILRKEMIYTRVGIKAIVAGSNYINPIPNRRLHSIESRTAKQHQGLLDGN